MEEIMLDLETLSVRSNAVIVIIGAVKFNRYGKLKPLIELDTFYRRVDIKSCTDVGLHIDNNTVKWWNTQKKDVKFEALEHPDRINIKKALIEFSEWMKPCEKIWGNGDDFDCTILGEAYLHCGIDIPWKFWHTRDCRTLFDLANVYKKNLPKNNEHHAIHDCYRQIVGVKLALDKLKIT